MAAGRLLIPSWMPALDGDGAPIPNARVYFYVNKTTTLASVYSDEALSVPLANPVAANSSGRFPAVWADGDALYSWSIDAPYGPAGIPFTGDNLSVSVSSEVLVLEAIESASGDASLSAAAAAQSAADAQEALQEMLDFAANAPDAPSVVNKLNRDGDNASPDLLDNLQFERSGATGNVPSSVNLNLSAYAIKAWEEFGVVMDGTDKSANLQLAIDEAMRTGKELWHDSIDEDGIPVAQTLRVRGLNGLPYAPNFRRGLTFRGTKSGATVFRSSVANGAFLDIASSDDFSSFNGMLQGIYSNFTIRQDAAVAASDGIRLRSVFQHQFEQFHIQGLSGSGIRIDCLTGDTDGSNMVMFENGRIEQCDGWGMDFEATSPHNEISALTCNNIFLQYCGTDESKAITAITQANPAVVTANAHGFVNGDRVYLRGVGGMTQVDSYVSNTSYVVAGATANTFQLQGVNSTGYSAFTSGGRVLPYAPKSGGLKWRGQQFRFVNSGAVLSRNVGIWLPGGAGLSQDAYFSLSSTENSEGMAGVVIHGGRNVEFDFGHHPYVNQALSGPTYGGVLIDGQDSLCSNIRINKPIPRNTAAEPNYVAFKQMGAFADRQTNRVTNVDWKQFDFSAGQRRFEGFLFDPIPQQTKLILISPTQVRLGSNNDGQGCYTPLRLRGPIVGTVPSMTGEWVQYAVPAAGINQANTLPGGGALAANTTYNVYLYDIASGTTQPGLDFSTTSFVKDADTGYRVKSDDATRLWVGRIRTDASAQFEITDTSWLNPDIIAAPVTGALCYSWVISNGWMAVKTGGNLPAFNVDYNYAYKPTTEELISAYDPPSVPANSFVQVDVALTGHAANDHILSVTRTGGWGDLGVYGTTKAANTMRLTLTNGTASPIDLAAANIYVEKLKR